MICVKYWTTESTTYALAIIIINVTIMENISYVIKVIVVLMIVLY